MEPPVAPALDGTDPYAWMRDTSDPALLAYLAAERAYYDQQTAHSVRLRDALAAEMSAGWRQRMSQPAGSSADGTTSPGRGPA
jgi:protease II